MCNEYGLAEMRSPWVEPKLIRTNLQQATLGMGGSTIDGNGNMLQSGGGNDGNNGGGTFDESA